MELGARVGKQLHRHRNMAAFSFQILMDRIVFFYNNFLKLSTMC